MQRIVALILVGFSIAMAPMAGLFAWQATAFEQTTSDREDVEPGIAYAFYAGLDRILAGGGSAELEEVVTEDFVDRSEGASTGRSTDELIEQLAAFAASFPQARIEVASVRKAGSTLVVEIVPVLTAPGRVAGVTVTPAPLGRATEILRIERGKVRERWANGLPALSAVTFDEAAGSSNLGASMWARIFRISLSGMSSLAWRAEEVAVVMVEAGSVELTTDVASGSDELVRQSMTIEAGSAVSIPAAAGMHVQSGNYQEAQFLLFAAHRFSSEQAGPFHLDGEATSKLLWKSSMPLWMTGPWRIEFGQLVLSPDMTVALGNTSDADLVLCTDGAPLELATEGGTLMGFGERYAMTVIDSPTALRSGAAIQVADASSATLAASDRSAVWMVRFGPTSRSVAPTSPAPGPRSQAW
jgi:hypothetical protein